jgi:hypothetical protein
MKHYFDKKLAPLPSEEIDVRIEETLKFLNMAAYIDGSIPVSPEIDEVWHYWILETHEYAQLCAKLQGGRFLHHRSNDYAEYLDKDVKAHDIDLQRDVGILSSYVLNYGPFEARRVKYWLLAAHLVSELGWDVERLNAWLNRSPGRSSTKRSGRPALARAL